MRAPPTVLVLAITTILHAPRLIHSQSDEVWSVTGVAGRATDLPCYLTPRTPGDTPKLILWYKETIRSPLFSHDTRRPPQLEGEVRQGEGVLTVKRGAASLTYHNVTPNHAGLYECRVDFYNSPAHSTFVNLTVVELPRSVQILDGQTGPAKNGVLGPYYIGQTVLITCISLDGWPLPNITWWKNNHIMGSGWEVTGPGQVQSDLVIERVSRDWHNQTVTCAASNTHLASPVSVSATIHLYLLPRTVVIRAPGAVREGSQARLVCVAEGSRPPPSVTWRVRRLIHRSHMTEEEGLVTVSTILVNVTREDDGALVTCSAQNPSVPGSVISNTTFLNVHYPPSVSVSLGRSLNAQLLKEGDDVYFTCTVDANPPASAITWYHEGTVQVQNMTTGVILSGDSLVLQKVSRRRAGEYKCSASNPLATVISAPVHLKIRYKPECLTTPTTYFIYDKPINVTCTVSSHPPVHAVHWQWNSSSDVIKTERVGGQTERASTQLTVYPIETYEDRLLSCWAVNEMGRQPLACGFSIKVAEMPLPLSSCRLANITASSLSLTCQRPDVATTGITLYRAEVYFDNRTLFANVTSTRPNFNVSRLDAGTSYQIKVYVTHGPVTSQPVVVSAYTSRSSRPSSENKQKGDEEAAAAAPGGGGDGGGGTMVAPSGTGVVLVSNDDDIPSDGTAVSAGDGTAVSAGGGGGGGGGMGVGGVGGVGAVMGVAAVSLVALVGVAWAWHYCRNNCDAKRKDVRLASADDANNPDVVPNIGSSFTTTTTSPQRFWHKEKTFDQSAGGAAAAAAGGSSGGVSEQTTSSNTIVDVGGVQVSVAGQSSKGGGEGQSPAGSPGESKLLPSPDGSQRSAGCISGSSPTASLRTSGCVGSSSPSGSLRTSGCVGSSSPSGSQRTTGCVGSASPSGSQRTTGCVGSSSPSGSQRTNGCVGSSSPSGSPRTTSGVGERSPSAGIQRIAKIQGSGSPISSVGVRPSAGGKVGGEGAGSRESPPIHRPTAGIVFRSALGSGGGANQRPLSAVGDIVVNPLRQSFLEADDDDFAGGWSEEEQPLPPSRDRATTFPEGGATKHFPREEQHKYPGVRFSLPPREEMPSYPGDRHPLRGSPREDGYYQGIRPKYKLREAESSPDIRSPYSTREERGYFGTRGQFSPRDERSSWAGLRAAEFSPKGERIFSGFRQFSPKEDRIYPGGSRLHSPREEHTYPGILPHQSPRDDHARPRPRDDHCSAVRPHRYSYIGVRVQHPTRDQLRHSYPTVHRSYPATARGPTGTYPGVRPGHGASRGTEGHQRGTRIDDHYPVDQLIKATETVV